MPNAKTKTKFADEQFSSYRNEVSIRAKTIDEENRSVEAVLSTETPVLMFDWERFEAIPEILLAEGMQIPRSKQVPLLDSHSRLSMSNQLGSVRDIHVNGTEVRGTLVYSSVHEDEFTKVREGHATDVSVGYRIIAREFVPEGKKKRINGRTFDGPVNVVTKSRLGEVSQTPIGADEQAKIRGLDPSKLSPPKKNKEHKMSDELRTLLVELGLEKDVDDETAERFLVDNSNKIREAFAKKDPDQPKKREKTTGDDGADLMDELRKIREEIGKQPSMEESIEKALKAREEQRVAFRSNVDGLCELAGIEDQEFTRSLYDKSDETEVREAILEHRAKQSEGLTIGHQPIAFGRGQLEKHRGAVGTALVMRAFNRCQVLNPNSPNLEAREKIIERIYPEDERANDWEQFRHATILEIAGECLRMDGIDTRGLTNDDIATTALGFGEQIGVRASDPAYHITGSFPFITQDAVNKSMMLGFVEFPSTWQAVMTQGDSVRDFKTIHRMQLGALPNVPIWDGLSVPGDASMKDEEETYAIECHSDRVSFNYKLLVNDDMSMLSRTPQRQGDAMARTVNGTAWAQITGNPTMRDAEVLFLETAANNRFRSNLTTGAGAPSATTIQILTDKMMQMRGTNTPEEAESEDILALMPSHIVGPSALRTTILQEVRSIADPNAGHSNVANLSNDLIPVIEPLLDANSTSAWYLFASTARVETVEVTFLQGQESPRLRTVLNADRLSQDHYILQTFAAKALEHRGMQRHDGV